MATLKTLFTFHIGDAFGATPRAGLTIDADGNLIGTASNGGADNDGTVFELPYLGGGVYGAPIALLTFTGPQGGPYPLGADPESPVFIDASGNIVGTTLAGGQDLTNPNNTPNDASGVLYEITNTGSGYVAASGPVLTFHNNIFDPVLDSQGHDIFGPEGSLGALVADSAGNLYGSSEDGGFIDLNNFQFGEIFEIPIVNGSYASTPTVLVNFEGIDGRNPEGPLIIDKDGDLFGTATRGGPSQTNGFEDDDGVVFELKHGNLTQPIVLASFTGTAGATPGATPMGGLVMDSAGDLFGTTTDGGVSAPFGGFGTVFEIPFSNGSYQPTLTLATFNNSNGATPTGSLLIDGAGNLWGTTFGGGPGNGDGTVFEIPSAGGYDQLIDVFTFDNDQQSGRGPQGLTADSHGNLFGTTLSGGPGNGADGTAFELTDTGFVVACYCRGTLIKMKRGEKPVEKLRIGDRVMTMSGIARPIKWIGTRSYGGRFATGHKDILPICFKAGALGESVPCRDLWISPRHAMYLEGVLIEARDLVNGISIVQVEQVDHVEYFHIELDSHDVMIAEGSLSESFVDDDSRGMFHNAHEYGALYPATERVAARYCARRCADGYEVEAARRAIDSRAGMRPEVEQVPTALRGYVDTVSAGCIAGWAQNPEHPEAPVCLDIFAGGRLIGQTLANRLRDDLAQAGIGSGRCGFHFVPPAGLHFAPGEVVVKRSLDGAALAIAAQIRKATMPAAA